jgi:hypothetical protein
MFEGFELSRVDTGEATIRAPAARAGLRRYGEALGMRQAGTLLRFRRLC